MGKRFTHVLLPWEIFRGDPVFHAFGIRTSQRIPEPPCAMRIQPGLFRSPKFSLGRLVQLLSDVIRGEALLFRGGFKSGGVCAARVVYISNIHKSYRRKLNLVLAVPHVAIPIERIRPRILGRNFFWRLDLRTRDAFFGVCTYLWSGVFVAAQKWISSGTKSPIYVFRRYSLWK